MRTAPDTSHLPTHPGQSGAVSMRYKVATQCDFAGPYGTGARMVQIITTGDDGRIAHVDYIPAADKPEAIAIARREGAVFTG